MSRTEILARLRSGESLSPEDLAVLREAIAEVTRAGHRLAAAAREHRGAMNPQEILDTGWTLDEAVEAWEALDLPEP